MKHKLTLLFSFLFIFAFILVPIVFAGTLGPGPVDASGKVLPGWNNMGAGWWNNGFYYSNIDGSIQAYKSNEFGALMNPVVVITDTTTYSAPSTASTACIPGTINTAVNQCSAMINNVPTLISFCSSTNNTGPCRPVRINQTAAQNLVQQVQALAQNRGYNATCNAERVGLSFGIDTNTGLNYYYNNSCVINGLSGVDAEQLATNPNAWNTLQTEIASQTGNHTGTTGGTTTGTTGTTGGTTTGGTTTTGPATALSSCYTSADPADSVAAKAASECASKVATQTTTNAVNAISAQIAQTQANYLNQIKTVTTSYLNDYIKTAPANNSQTTNTTKGSTIASCQSSLNVDLQKGSFGTDVNTLTKYLMNKGFMSNIETTFDQSVFDAVVAFQNSNKDAILTPVGLTSGTGFVGQSTRRFINNELCGTSNSQTSNPSPSVSKAIFTSNTTDVMYVGDAWNIVVTGLNPQETIYATGGKKVNGVVPLDKTPYTADSLGIFSKIGNHSADVVGDWQIVWTRADGTVLGTLVFTVKPFALPYITSLSSSSLKAGDSLQILGSNFKAGVTLVELVNQQGGITSLTVGSLTGDKIVTTIPSGVIPGEYNLQLRYVGTGIYFSKTSNMVLVNISL